MKLKLEHEKLTNILMDFYTLSHIRIVIYDSSFQRIAAYPERSSDFCSLLKQNYESKMLCRKSESESCIICSKKKFPSRLSMSRRSYRSRRSDQDE